MTAAEQVQEHIHDVQRIGRFEACITPGCGEIFSERWEPRSLTDVEYLMGLEHADNVQIAALKQRINNLQRMIKQHEARKSWLRFKFLPAIRNIVGAHLADTKSKRRSVTLEYGDCGFRMSRGSIEIVDHDAAVAWAEAHVPEAVEVTKQVRKLPLKGLERELPASAFRVNPPADVFFTEVTS